MGSAIQSISPEKVPVPHQCRGGCHCQLDGLSIANPALDGWVVPYNPYFLKKYRCHINVEVAATVNLMAYFYKYIYKGHDHVRYALQDVAQTENSAVDEIAQYI